GGWPGGSARRWRGGTGGRCRRSARNGRARPLGLAVGGVAIEHAGRRELAELVTDHFLGDHHRDVLLPIVDAERQSDELRQDRRAPAPDLDHLVPARRARGFRLLEQIAVDEPPFPDRPSHHVCLILLPRVAACQDELGGGLVAAGLLALGGEAPRRHRMTAAGGATLPAAMRMVDRVHRDAAVVRTAAHPAFAAGLADRNIHIVRVRYRADGGHAAAVDQALLGRVQAQDDVVAVAADDLRVGAGRARDLAAFAELELDVVDDGADRNITERHGVARLHVHILARDHGVACGQPLRREDVGEFAVLVLDQGDEAGAVRIIFDPLDGRRYVELAAFEVDLAVGLLVTAAAETDGDTAVVVASTR